MRVLCSPQGLMEGQHPGQGVRDILASGLKAGVLDFSLFCPLALVNKYGWDMVRLRRWLREAEQLIALAREQGLDLPLALAPFWPWEARAELEVDFLLELTWEALRLAAKAGAEAVLVRPAFCHPTTASGPPPLKGRTSQGAEDAMRRFNREFYLKLVPLAKELGLQILLMNGLRNVGGHLVRGLCAEPREAARWLEELNLEAGEEIFGFALDMEAANLCGQDMQALIHAVGPRLQAVLVSDRGPEGAAYLPFLGGGHRKGLRADWLGLLRGLRDIAFDGFLVLNLRDTAAPLSPLLRPALLPLVKRVADYLVWQIELEKPLRTYPSVVLFGAGNMCLNYMSCYGEKYPPIFTCDNNPKRWGEKFAGLEVRSPEALRETEPDTVILICNIYYREIEAQLQEMALPNPIAYFNDEYLPTFTAERIDWSERGE